MDITTITCYHFDSEHITWVKSTRDFEYNDIFNRNSGIFFTKDKYEVESMFETLTIFSGVITFYAVLAWYLDNVIPANRGVPKPLSFFIWPSFWFPGFFGSNTYHAQEGPIQYKEQKNYISERKELLKLEIEEKTNNVNGIRCLGLSKTYRSIMSGNDNEALKGVYFQIQKGELLGVMGHNGAGKTTLINVLCGLVHKNGGNARIFDSDIERSLSKCRKRMGVVS
jgi:ABC-type multidrug transport system fused ATPase/permease subunit